MPKPPFRADRVGSHLRSNRIAEVRAAHGDPHLLCTIEDKEIPALIRMQEDTGLKVVTVEGPGAVPTLMSHVGGSDHEAGLRATDVIAGRPPNPFMAFGDRVRIRAWVGGEPLFGVIDQQVVRATLG